MLGRGGVADVYRAEDLGSHEQVAVKVLRDAEATDVRRFEREARALERVDHPAVVRLRDEGEHEGTPFLVLDLVDGEPLSRLLDQGRLEEEYVARLGASMAGALAQAHELGIVHRDVKPGNVLVSREGSFLLSDFGIARLVDTAAITSITDTGLVIGTAAYLSPEQVRGEGAGPEADVYSLGLVMIEGLNGQRAFEGTPTEAALARLESSPAIPPAAPWLSSLLASMTATDARRRPTAATVADACERRQPVADEPTIVADHTAVLPIVAPAMAATLSPAPPSMSPPPMSRPPMSRPPARYPGRRGRGALLAALAAAAIVLALVLFAVSGTSQTPSSGDAPTPSTSAATSPATNSGTSVATTSTAPITLPGVGPVRVPTPGGKDKHGHGPGG